MGRGEGGDVYIIMTDSREILYKCAPDLLISGSHQSLFPLTQKSS